MFSLDNLTLNVAHLAWYDSPRKTLVKRLIIPDIHHRTAMADQEGQRGRGMRRGGEQGQPQQMPRERRRP